MKLFPTLFKKRTNSLRFTAAIAGVSVALTGIAVMLGWHFDVTTLTQPVPTTESMRYNTALLLAMTGTSLVLLTQTFVRTAFLLAMSTAILGFVTLLQYLVNINLGIDDLFFKHPVVSSTSFSDRMAPNSAIGFLLVGLAMALNARPSLIPYAKLTAALLSSLLLGLSIVALFGYLVGVETAYGWGKLTSMAIHTAATFILCGIGLLAFLYAEASKEGDYSPRLWTAPVMGLLGITIATAAWQALDSRESKLIQRTNSLELTAFQSHFESALRTDHNTLRRMAARMMYAKDYDPGAWHADARKYVNDFPGYIAMAWLNSLGRVIETTEISKEYLQSLLPSAELLASTRLNRDFTVGPITQLSHGSIGFTEVLPLYRNSELQGFLVVQKIYSGMFDPMLTEMPLREYDLQFFDRDTLVYSRVLSGKAEPRWRSEITLSAAARDWHLHVTPSTTQIHNQRSLMPPIVLSGGVIIALLFGMVIRLWQIKRNHTLELAASEARLRSVSDNMLEAMIIVDSDSVIQNVNPATENLFGYQRDELIGHHLKKLMPESLRPAGDSFLRTAHRLAIDKTSEWEAQRKDGTVFPFSLSLYEIAAPQGARYFACMCTDISQRKQAEEIIRKLSLTDELTGLYNRRGFLTLAEQQLKMARRTQGSLQIGFVDIDGLKTINDRLGHAMGDLAIKDVAGVLTATYRESDLIARIGGDEFVVLTIGINATEMAHLLEKLVGNVAQLNRESNRPFHLSLSVGYVSCDTPEEVSLDALLQQADQRMYLDKDRKRKSVNR